VEVYLAGSRQEVGGDAAENLQRLAAAGIAVTEAVEADTFAGTCSRAGLVVDALLGTGLSGQVSGLVARLIEAINECGTPVLAVDVPSGLDADRGRPLGLAVRATETVTMGLPKLGLFLVPGIDYAGRVTVADIGFPPELVSDCAAAGDLVEREWVRMLLPPRRRSAHKGDFGHVLAIAGSAGLSGAAAMCAQAALRVGAGLVTVGCPDSLNEILEIKLTEAMTHPLPETYERSLDTRALAPILELAPAASVVAIGPGLSTQPETVVLVRRLVTRLDRPMVIDADALNALAGAAVLLEGEHAPAVLTPHPALRGSRGRTVQICYNTQRRVLEHRRPRPSAND
jgi:NAD(P)H-hydrate epimerase